MRIALTHTHTTLTARRLLTTDGWRDNALLHLEDGFVVRMENAPHCDSTDILVPSFFDIHFHGAMGYDLMAATPPQFAEIERFLATRGVGAYLPTTVTSPLDDTLRALERLGSAVASAAQGEHTPDCAIPRGIHLEGPFISHEKRGVQPSNYILEPSIALFDRFQEAAGGHIRLMTMAPELPNALELIEHASARGVRISLGHSNATAAEARAGITAGAQGATHTFNAMRSLDHREPGVLGTVLDADDLFAELICDGIHVDPVLVRLWLRMKGEQRAILVTDGMAATGMPDGTYRLGDFPVEVHNGTALADGRLAGSVLTMDRAIENVQAYTGCSLETAVRLASTNPAALLGLSGLGAAAVGQPANFNVFSPEGKRRGTILRGERLQTSIALN